MQRKFALWSFAAVWSEVVWVGGGQALHFVWCGSTVCEEEFSLLWWRLAAAVVAERTSPAASDDEREQVPFRSCSSTNACEERQHVVVGGSEQGQARCCCLDSHSTRLTRNWFAVFVPQPSTCRRFTVTVATLSHRRHLPALRTSSKQIFNPQSVFVHTVATRTFWKCRKTTVAVVVGLWDDCSCLLRECGIVRNTQRRAWSTLNCDCSLQRKAMFAASRAFESVTLWDGYTRTVCVLVRKRRLWHNYLPYSYKKQHSCVQPQHCFTKTCIFQLWTPLYLKLARRQWTTSRLHMYVYAWCYDVFGMKWNYI